MDDKESINNQLSELEQQNISLLMDLLAQHEEVDSHEEMWGVDYYVSQIKQAIKKGPEFIHNYLLEVQRDLSHDDEYEYDKALTRLYALRALLLNRPDDLDFGSKAANEFRSDFNAVFISEDDSNYGDDPYPSDDPIHRGMTRAEVEQAKREAMDEYNAREAAKKAEKDPYKN